MHMAQDLWSRSRHIYCLRLVLEQTSHHNIPGHMIYNALLLFIPLYDNIPLSFKPMFKISRLQFKFGKFLANQY